MKRVAALAAAAVCGLGVFVVREATMSRHAPAVPGTRTEVVVEVRSNSDDIDLGERAVALVHLCQLEAPGQLVDPGVERLDEHTFSFSIAPALDTSDERQVDGCLEDLRIDHLQAKVVEMRRR